MYKLIKIIRINYDCFNHYSRFINIDNKIIIIYLFSKIFEIFDSQLVHLALQIYRNACF